MYAKNNNYATFYTSNMANTDKVTYGRVSVPIKTGRKNDHGKDVYEFESWTGRFVGKAREKALALTDKTRITLTEWAAHPGYNKDKKQSYPYLVVMDFEVREQAAAAGAEMSMNDYLAMDDDE